MSNPVFLILLLLLKYYQARLISVMGVVSQGPSIPSEIYDQDIAREIHPFLQQNLLPRGMTLHTELGRILRIKYIDSDGASKEYGNFSKIDNFETKVRIYSSSSPNALQSAIGEAIGLMPKNTPNVLKINEKGEKAMLLEDQTSSAKEVESLIKMDIPAVMLEKQENLKNYTLVEYFSQSLDVILKSEKCLIFKDDAQIKINKNTKLNIKWKSNSTNSFPKVLIPIAIMQKNFTLIMNKNKNLHLNETHLIIKPPTTLKDPKLITDEDFNKILTLKNFFPSHFLNHCNKTLCKNDLVFRDLEFLDSLYQLARFVTDFHIKLKTIKNNFLKNKKTQEKKIAEISDDVVEVLFKYHLLHIYNHEETISKQIATPLFRFVNGFLENSKSKHCEGVSQVQKNNANITSNVKSNKTATSQRKERAFVRLRVFKPIDILRRTINDCKCSKIVLMVSEFTNHITFVKTLFHYEKIVNQIIDDPKYRQADSKLMDLIDPKPASSVIFQLHEYESEQNNQHNQIEKNANMTAVPTTKKPLTTYVRIFFNLEEISNLPLQLKITYEKDRGVPMDELVNYFNEHSDSKVKYKNKCEL
jgi:hypothetical protein